MSHTINESIFGAVNALITDFWAIIYLIECLNVIFVIPGRIKSLNYNMVAGDNKHGM